MGFLCNFAVVVSCDDADCFEFAIADKRIHFAFSDIHFLGNVIYSPPICCMILAG